MKKRFRIIIVLMVISLFSLLIIQGLWIAYAIKTEKAKFDQLVYDAMSSAISKVEQRSVFEFIDERIELPEPNINIAVTIDEAMDANESLDQIMNLEKLENLDQITVISSIDNDEDIRFVDDTLVKNSKIIVRTPNTSKFTKKFILTDSSTLYSYSFTDADSFKVHSLDSVDHISHYHFYDSLKNKLQLEQAELLIEKEKVVKNKLEAFNENIEKWVMEFSFSEDLFFPKERIAKYENALISSLSNNGIKINFNYQITKENDTVIEIFSSVPADKINNFQYKTEIFPDDIFSKNLFLSLRFPDKNSLIYSKVYALLIGSILFTVIILITFISTIYYMQKQKKVSEVKSDFINNMTHEFKTPIATIRLATDAMESPKVIGIEKSIMYYLNIIRQENKRMNNQVERVLQMALIDQGQLQLDIQKNDIHSIINNCINVVQLSVNKKEGEITSSLRATCFNIDVDEIHFANVINNLLDNAIKYNNNKPSINIETYNQQNSIYIRVSDNGVGMTKDVQKHIFDKFYRKPMGNIHNIKGFGLGLSYVKAIIDEHKGEISLTSDPGNGSSFLIKFICQNKNTNHGNIEQ